jgi:hypothetical protein
MYRLIMFQNWLSNGLGGQSIFMLHLAALGELPSRVSITADTGSELDRVCSNGERMTAPAFFERFVKPYALDHGIEALLVRAQDENQQDLPAVITKLRSAGTGGNDFESIIKGISVPLFTNDKSRGRLRQSCTDKWKIRAINQEAKRRGVTPLRIAIGYHAGECHRLKARFIKTEDGFSIYKPQVTRDGAVKDVQWLEHYYPLIDLGLDREAIRARLVKAGLPYLITTECDCCPHQDYARWIMHTPEVIDELAAMESRWHGKLFLTDQRIPLKQALEVMRLKQIQKEAQGELPAFGCENGAYCGI